MRTVRIVLALAAILVTQPLFAHHMSESKACGDIAKACLDAGYTREETASKKFWEDCMKPTVMGQAVEGVKVEADAVKTCRTDKIAAMKKELKELEAASKK